jgi:hypothetical protein
MVLVAPCFYCKRWEHAQRIIRRKPFAWVTKPSYRFAKRIVTCTRESKMLGLISVRRPEGDRF